MVGPWLTILITTSENDQRSLIRPMNVFTEAIAGVILPQWSVSRRLGKDKIDELPSMRC